MPSIVERWTVGLAHQTWATATLMRQQSSWDWLRSWNAKATLMSRHFGFVDKLAFQHKPVISRKRSLNRFLTSESSRKNLEFYCIDENGLDFATCIVRIAHILISSTDI
jgi:hypothetical protein